MARNKQNIKLNNTESVESVLQEVYIEACNNIRSCQESIDTLKLGVKPQDVDEYTKISKATTDAIKEKTASLRLKLEVAKLQVDSLKHSGDMASKDDLISKNNVTEDGFAAIRKLIMDKAKASDIDNYDE